MNHLIDNLDISPARTRLGIISYSDTASINLRLRNFMPKDLLKVVVGGVKLQSNHSRTDLALQTARCKLLTAEGGARGVDVPKVIVVMTDGTLAGKVAGSHCRL